MGFNTHEVRGVAERFDNHWDLRMPLGINK